MVSATPTGKDNSLMTLEDAMIDHINKALRQTKYRISGPDGAAKLLGINPNTLRSRMQKLGLSKSGRYQPIKK